MPHMSLFPGEVFAGFVIERELGAGGMGVVYSRGILGCPDASR